MIRERRVRGCEKVKANYKKGKDDDKCTEEKEIEERTESQEQRAKCIGENSKQRREKEEKITHQKD